MEEEAPPAAAAAYHPHLLQCQPQAPIPAVGTAVFALRPRVEEHNRLVYLPINAPHYFRDSASLAERVWNNPEATAAVVEAGKDVRKIRPVLEALPNLPIGRVQEISRFGAKDARRDIDSLFLEGPLFLGVMVPDNLTPSARAWWAQTGVLQATTCIKGAVEVAFTAELGGPAAFDVFRPLSTAAWNLDTGVLEPFFPDDPAQYPIGVVLGAGVDRVTLYIDVTRDFNERGTSPAAQPARS